MPTQTAQYSDIVKQMEQLWTFINDKHFKGELKVKPLITIASRGTKRNTLAWFWAARWSQDGKVFNEINFSAETFNRPKDAIYETMLHECVHQMNHQNGIRDCSPNQHHNKKYKIAAETAGLIVTKTAKGWNHTELNEDSKKQSGAYTGVLTSDLSRPPRLKPTKKMYTVPTTANVKQWFEQKSTAMGISQKDLVEMAYNAYVRAEADMEAV